MRLSNTRVPLPDVIPAEITFAWTRRPMNILRPAATVLGILLDGSGRIPSVGHAAFSGQPETSCGALRLASPLEFVSGLPSRHMPFDEDEIFSETFFFDPEAVPGDVRQLAFLLHIEDARGSNMSTWEVENLMVATRTHAFWHQRGDRGARARWLAFLAREGDGSWSFGRAQGFETREGLDVLGDMLAAAAA